MIGGIVDRSVKNIAFYLTSFRYHEPEIPQHASKLIAAEEELSCKKFPLDEYLMLWAYQKNFMNWTLDGKEVHKCLLFRVFWKSFKEYMTQVVIGNGFWSGEFF